MAPLRRPRLPGNFLMSQKSAQLVGALFQLVGVVGEHRGPDEETHAARLDGAGHEVLGLAELRRVEFLEQAFVAAARQLRRLHFHQVPGHAVGIDHGLDLGHLAVVFAGDDPVAGGFLVGLVERLDLGALVGPAEGHHGQVHRHGLGRAGQAGRQGGELQAGRFQGFRHYCSLHSAGLLRYGSGLPALTPPAEGRAPSHARPASPAEPHHRRSASGPARRSAA